MITFLRLIRKEFRADGIFGELRDENDDLIAVTLEHAYGSKEQGWSPKIPEGKYLCLRGWHQLGEGEKFVTFEITGVPGHTGILFHVGNKNEDSSGCVLLGRAINYAAPGIQWIFDSKVTFEKFMALQEGTDSFNLSVSNPEIK